MMLQGLQVRVAEEGGLNRASLLFGVWGLEFRVWGLGSGVQALGFT